MCWIWRIDKDRGDNPPFNLSTLSETEILRGMRGKLCLTEFAISVTLLRVIFSEIGDVPETCQNGKESPRTHPPRT